MRLEDYLLDSFPTVSKMYLRELVRDERCEVNGRAENIGYRIRSNDLVEIWIDATRGTAMVAEEHAKAAFRADFAAARAELAKAGAASATICPAS